MGQKEPAATFIQVTMGAAVAQLCDGERLVEPVVARVETIVVKLTQLLARLP